MVAHHPALEIVPSDGHHPELSAPKLLNRPFRRFRSPSRAPAGYWEDQMTTAVLDTVAKMAPSDVTTTRRVLLVEDDDVLRRNYEALLTAHRLSVCACATKAEAVTAFANEPFDVVILDVTLGGDYEAGF